MDDPAPLALSVVPSLDVSSEAAVPVPSAVVVPVLPFVESVAVTVFAVVESDLALVASDYAD